jgi:hypothetical protein
VLAVEFPLRPRVHVRAVNPDSGGHRGRHGLGSPQVVPAFQKHRWLGMRETFLRVRRPLFGRINFWNGR